MRLLDLFCGAGGAAMGYHRAGFDEIVGIDLAPQKNYPFTFIQGDALNPPVDLEAFDLIHASPPCQAFTSMRVMANARQHHDLLTTTRQLLEGLPFVIENVPGAPMDIRPADLFGTGGGIELCGSMFELRTDLYELRRHRWFESSYPLIQPMCRHSHRTVVGFYGDHARTRRRTKKLDNKDAGEDITGTAAKLALVDALMDIDWMAWTEAKEAIPPAYTEYLGRQFLDQLARR